MFKLSADEMRYEKVGSDTDVESTENLLSKSDEHHYTRPSARTKLCTVLNAGMFCASLGFFTMGYIQNHPSHQEMMRQTSFYSPVWDTIKLSAHDTVVKGDLWTYNETDPYRNFMDPDDNVEAHWEALEDIRVFPITKAQLLKLGKDPDVSVKFPPEYGLGDDAYMGQIDMFHQIHCLNLLRHQAWKGYDHNKTIHSEPYRPLHWIHVSHCTDILLKNIMCAGSVDIVTYQWKETQHRPWPDFDVNHKCRSFDEIKAWQEEHSVPLDWGRNVTRPYGFKEVPMSDLFFELSNITREDAAKMSAQNFQEDHADKGHDH